VEISNDITTRHYVNVNALVLTDFGTNIRRYKTLKIATKLVLWMLRQQQNKCDQLEKLLSVLFKTAHTTYHDGQRAAIDQNIHMKLFTSINDREFIKDGQDVPISLICGSFINRSLDQVHQLAYSFGYKGEHFDLGSSKVGQKCG